MTHLKSQDGAVTLAVVIAIFFSALALVSTLSFIGIGELISGDQTSTSERALTAADSCLHEALLRLKNDEMYAGGTLSVGSDSCTIAVSGFGSDRTIAVATTSRHTTRQIEAAVTLSGNQVSLDTWLEK
ncbi:hypothetical protein KJ611_02065 [Patescibacteria group bacterium]|nr:hypothetical protein [Patescibacteria group bacterium]MBU1705309.1 hypothetical protein [Patescibacteria group bacterium]